MKHRNSIFILERKNNIKTFYGSDHNTMNVLKIGFLVFIVFLITSGVEVNSENSINIEKYSVKEGDTLWFIAKTVSGDATKWHDILKTNPLIKDPQWIYPGQVFTIEKSIINQNKTSEPDTLLMNDSNIQTSSTNEKSSLLTFDTEDNQVIDTSEEISSNKQESIENEKPQPQNAKNKIALDLLISSLINDIKGSITQNDSLSISQGKNISLIGKPSQNTQLPVYSLVFVTDEDLQKRDKYFVSDSEAYIISKGKLIPVDEIPSTTEMCDKVRNVAQIIEEKGRYLFFEESVESYSNHSKMIIFSSEEYYYYFILSNVNEHSPALLINKEPIDVLRVRIFSDNGYMYFTDKGLQGFPGFFYAADEYGNAINIALTDPIIFEKFDKALDIFLAEMSEKETQKTDPRAKEKLNRIF